MGLVKYDFDQLPPPQKCPPQYADNISAHLALHPDELVSYPEVQMSFRVDHDFSKEWIFVIRPVHDLHKVKISLYIHVYVEIGHLRLTQMRVGHHQMARREPLRYPGSTLHCRALVARLSLPDDMIVWPLRNVFLRTAEQVVAQPLGQALHLQIRIRGPDVSHPAGWPRSSETDSLLLDWSYHPHVGW